jgi:hypothetical protein
MEVRARILDRIREPIAKSLGVQPQEVGEGTVVPVDIAMDYEIEAVLEAEKLWPAFGFGDIQIKEEDTVGRLIDLIVDGNKEGG